MISRRSRRCACRRPSSTTRSRLRRRTLHMPSHIYSMLGMWEDSVRSNLASKAAADEYAAKYFPDQTHPSVPHLLDFIVYADLQMARDRDAQQLVDSLP